MFLHSRRFSVWLVSLLVVLISYLVYNRMSRSPMMTSTVKPGEIADVCDSQGPIGRVGDVGVGVMKNVHYVLLNDQKEVEGEFGFERLLHQDGNDWELEGPYYRIYRRGFKCELKGERARITVEAAGDRVSPQQGILTGNVVINITPQREGAFSRGVVYLDDVVFVGDKSLFSTAGVVEYVSEDAHLVGKGMELIYNSDEERLEFLKITKLDSLTIKRWSRPESLSNSRTETTGQSLPETKKPDDAQSGYKCVLDTNVIIETPQERLMAQLLSINDISAGRQPRDDSGKQQAEGPNDTLAKGKAVPSQEAAGDVEIRCDGSIIIVPMDSTLEIAQLPLTGTQTAQFINSNNDSKTMFYGDRLDYSVETGEAVATGLSQVSFDVNDKTLASGGRPAKVMITAKNQARFEPASNKITLDGDSRCTITQQGINYVRQYFVVAESLEVDLMQQNGRTEARPSLKHFTATGDAVHLAGTRKAGERLLGGVELKCTRVDYDAEEDKFVAIGPGLIKMDNSQTDEPQKGLGRFSLRRKSYAFLRNFDYLEFDRAGKHLVAYSREGSMLADLIPVSDNDSRDRVAVTASRVEADIEETSAGRTEIAGLVAKGAVTYEDKDVQCAGGEFVYDADGPLISMRGDGSRPCIFNGAIVDSAWRDPKSGKWRTRLKGPGAIK